MEIYFRLDLNSGENRAVSYLNSETGDSFRFRGHILSKKNLAKLYIVKEGDKFLYVGVTFQPLTSRLRYGFYANGKNGYHGYGWKDKNAMQMHIWCFPEIDKNHLEGIEAELVFLIRTKTGFWPLNQTEIHFNNKFEDSQQIAEQLYDVLSFKLIKI